MSTKTKEWLLTGILTLVVIAAIVFFWNESGQRVLALTYAGLTRGAVLFVPGWLYAGAALFGLFTLPMLGLYAYCVISYSINPPPFWQPRRAHLMAICLVVGQVVLFGLARFDYWAVYPDRVVLQQPYGRQTYAFSQINGVELDCDRGRRMSGDDLQYELKFGWRTLDMAREGFAVSGHDLAYSVWVIENLQPLLKAQGTPMQNWHGDRGCLGRIADRLPGGIARLNAIGF